MHIWRGYLLRVCVIVWTMLPVSAGVSFASGQVTLSFSPDAVALAPGETAQGVVIVKNEFDQTLNQLTLSAFSEPGVTATITPPDQALLPPGGSLPFVFGVTRRETGPSEVEVYFRLDYRQISEDAPAEPIPGVTIGKLTVKERTSVPLELSAIAELKVESNIDNLVEKRPGRLFAIVTNKFSRSVTISAVRVQHPYFVQIRSDKIETPIVLNPYNSRLFAFSIEMDDQVQPGSHHLVAEVDIAWRQNGHSFSATLIHPQPFAASALGESELIEIFKIPSLLLLPGFLILTMFLWLWQFSPKTPELMKASDPEYWMFSILLSFVTAALYPAVTRLMGEPRSFIRAYGVKDIMAIWVFSLALALFSWVLIAGAISIWRKHRLKKKARLTFDRNTSASEVLRKLARNRSGLLLERGQVNGRVLYKLQRNEDSTQPFWAAPAIQIVWNDNVSPSDVDKLKFLGLAEAPENPQNLFELADLLDAIASKKAEVAWENGSGPEWVTPDQWTADLINGNLAKLPLVVEA